MLTDANNSTNPNVIANFFIKTRESAFFSIVNMTSIIYIIVLGLTLKDFYSVMATWVVVVQLIGISVILANLILLYKTGNSPRSAGIMLFCMFVIHMADITFAGGINTPHFAWIFIFPILAGGTMGWRGQLFFYIMCFVVTVYFAIYPENMTVLAYQDSMGFTLFTRLMALTVFTFIMMIYYFTLKEKINHVSKALDLASFESGLFLGVFNSKAQNVLLVNAEGDIVRANNKAHSTFGFTDNTLINTPINKLCHSGLEMLNNSAETPIEHESSLFETRITTNVGNTLWVEYTSLRIADENAKVHILITLEDITSRKNHESELSYLAHYDHLTKLPNRLSIHEQLDDMISNAKRYQFDFAVIFFDLDKFKNVNDIQGHKAGDTVLVEVANRLQENIRRSDVVARFGGD
ncbi:MAG: PAS domain S-box-containing protein, partial [Glaciecola sp.]